jgi:hypothetical protein
MKPLLDLGAFFLSQLCMVLLNPRGMWQAIKQSVGQVTAPLRWMRQGSPLLEDIPALSLPFHGEWKTANGGVDKPHSHSWGLVSQRYAYDFLIEDEQGKTFRTSGKTPDDYFCWGQDILSPADGVVVAIENSVRDYSRASMWTDWMTSSIVGNFVVIQHAERVYSLSAHLQKNSVCVKTGDRVERGQAIGKCGHSGNSTEPHLHFQLQDRADFFDCVGLPIVFANAQIREKETITAFEETHVRRGQFVKTVSTFLPQKIERGVADIQIKDILMSLLSSFLTLLGIFAFFRWVLGFLIGLFN